MALAYHQKSLELLGITPTISKSLDDRIASFEAEHKIEFPAALREWYVMENSGALLQRIAVIHNIVEINEMPEIQQHYRKPFSVSAPLPILVENQGVWHMAINPDEGENPPVYIRYNEPDEPWILHANSFSEWILALSWDCINIWESKGKITSFSLEKEDYLSSFQIAAPETYVGNVYFRGKKFVRMEKDNEPLLVIY
jgi:hypothetical protein